MTLVTVFGYILQFKKEGRYALEENECRGRTDQVYSWGFAAGSEF
jgi:hypothetical protein